MTQKQGYTKTQFMRSSQFNAIEKDVLNSLLGDGIYTVEQAKKALEQFQKKEAR